VIDKAGQLYGDSLDDHEIELPRALAILEKRGRHKTTRAMVAIVYYRLVRSGSHANPSASQKLEFPCDGSNLAVR
jgi:hypothetical protein